MKHLHYLLLVATSLVVSCASNKKDAKPEATHQSLSQRLQQSGGYKQDAAGNWVPQSDKRSSFEQKGQSPYFQGEYGKKTYQTGSYDKKSWWGGTKDYGHKKFNTTADGSRFQQTSPLTAKNAPEATAAPHTTGTYQTGTYPTQAAREAGRKGIAKPSDTETDIRRSTYEQPEITDWRQQRSLSVDQSRGILGR